MKPLEILAFVIIAIGFAVVLVAKLVVKKFDLSKKQNCEYSDGMSEVEIEEYKFSKAVVNVKLIGLVTTVPGLILFVLSYK